MDGKTGVLISLGASVAANCVPCFQHYLERAETVGLTRQEIQEAVDMAMRVKSGAAITVRASINDLLEGKGQKTQPCCAEPDASCCG
jgi:AhpD family alkylhydroperoxidase